MIIGHLAQHTPTMLTSELHTGMCGSKQSSRDLEKIYRKLTCLSFIVVNNYAICFNGLY